MKEEAKKESSFVEIYEKPLGVVQDDLIEF